MIWNTQGSGWDAPVGNSNEPTSGPVEDTAARQYRERLARMVGHTMPDADPDDEYDSETEFYEGGYNDPDDDDDEPDQRETASARFMRNGALKCPCCESTNIKALGVRQPFSAMRVRVNNVCGSCEATWATMYGLMGIEDIDEPGGMDEDAMKRLGIS